MWLSHIYWKYFRRLLYTFLCSLSMWSWWQKRRSLGWHEWCEWCSWWESGTLDQVLFVWKNFDNLASFLCRSKLRLLLLVSLDMLEKMIWPDEGSAASLTDKLLLSSVSSLVSRQLITSSKYFVTVSVGTVERFLTCRKEILKLIKTFFINTNQYELCSGPWDGRVCSMIYHIQGRSSWRTSLSVGWENSCCWLGWGRGAAGEEQRERHLFRETFLVESQVVVYLD